MILKKTVLLLLLLSMIGIQFAANAEEAHHQDAEEIEYLKQLVGRLTLGQNTILQGLIRTVEKQSSKIKGANEDVIERIQYEVLQEAIEKVESLRELGLDDLDIEGIQWVTAKLTGATTEEDAIAKVLKGMNNQDLKALKKNIDGKVLHHDQKELLGVLEEMDDDELETFMESMHENDLVFNKASHMPIDHKKVLHVLEDMDEDELEAFIENMNENEVGDRNRNLVLGILEDTHEEDSDGIITKVYDEDIEQVMDKLSDNELKVVLKNVEDQELGELVTSMNDQDFIKVMRNLKGDTEKISMARDIVKIIQSEELDDLTHQQLEQHGKELSKSRKRRDLNDVLGEVFSSTDVLSTNAGHQKLMTNIVEKEKESRERNRVAADILEKQKDHLMWGEAEEMYKEPTYLASNFEPEGESEERKKSAGYLGLLSLYEHSRKRRHVGLDWLFGPDTTINSLIGHQAEPDTNSEPYLDQDFLNPFTKLFHREPDSYPETTYSEPKITHQSQWTYYEPQPEPQFEPSYHEPQSEPEPTYENQPTPSAEPLPEPESEPTYENQPTPSAEPLPEPTYEHQPTPSAEPEPQPTVGHEPTCTGSDPICLEPQPTCDESDPSCNEPQPTCDESDPTCNELQPTCDESDPSCNEPQPTCDESDPTCRDPQPTCDESDPTCRDPQPTCDESDPSCNEPQPTCDESDPSCNEPQPTCDESDPTCREPQPNSPPETTDEEPRPTCDSSDPTCNGHQSTCKGSDPTCLEPKPTCDGSDPLCQESQPNSPPEDTPGDHDDHYHHHTTISLGSNVYRTSADTSTLTENNAPYEKVTLSNGAPKKTRIYLSRHSKLLKNSHMDTLNSVKLPHDRDGLSLRNEEYSVPQADRKNNAPNEKLTLPTIHRRQHSKPLNSHMDTLKSEKKAHEAAPTATPFSWSTFRERRESVRPQISQRMKSAELEKSVPNL